MIRVPITFNDFDGNEVTEIHYFHLSKVELLAWVAENDGEDLGQRLERIGKSRDGALIMRTFADIIERAYGERVDGNSSSFYKNPEKTRQFMSSLAFDQLFEDLITNSTSAAAFVNGLMPAGLDKLAEIAEKAGQQKTDASGTPASEAPDLPELRRVSGLQNPLLENGEPVPWLRRKPNQRELTTMSHNQLLEVMHRDTKGWNPEEVQETTPA